MVRREIIISPLWDENIFGFVIWTGDFLCLRSQLMLIVFK